MPTQILVASAHPAFGELLRLSLEKSSNYRVKLVRNGTEILTAVNRDRFEIAIIDADIKDQPFVPLVQNLLAQYPAMRMVIIPPESEVENQSLSGLGVDGFLQKPFYLPDLLQLVDRLLQSPATRMEKGSDLHFEDVELSNPIAPDWLKSKLMVEKSLGRAMQGTKAMAVLVLKENDPWAKAGSMEISALNELMERLKGFYETPTQLHRLRFIRLSTMDFDVMFYCLTLILGYTLCAVYPYNTPLKKVRQQVIHLANALSSQSSNPYIEPEPVQKPTIPQEILKEAGSEGKQTSKPGWTKESDDDVILSREAELQSLLKTKPLNRQG